MYDTHLSVTPWKASYTYNEVITFSCSDGYQISGSTSTTCEKSGYFHGSLPKCTGFIFFSLLELLMEMFDIYVFCMYISFVFDAFHLWKTYYTCFCINRMFMKGLLLSLSEAMTCHRPDFYDIRIFFNSSEELIRLQRSHHVCMLWGILPYRSNIYNV